MSINNIINKSLENLAINGITGKNSIYVNLPTETSLFGSGIALDLGKNELTSANKLKRVVTSLTPRASIILKKKFFFGFKNDNDIQWLDKTEKLFLRCVKALFAYKVSQIRAYESLTKLQDFYRETNLVNLNLFVDAYNQAKILKIPVEVGNTNLLSIVGNAITNGFENLKYDSYKEDVLKILQRDAFSTDIRLTTWIVDPTSIDNYGTGPGTGVIELTNVSDFNTSVGTDSEPSPASFVMTDPYKISNIYDEDIEMAIKEALMGTVGVFQAVINGEIGIENVDTVSIAAAALELGGVGRLESTIDIDHIRERLRTFFLGKSLVNPGDTVHFFVRSEKTIHQQDDYFDESFFQIDETILEAERRLFTNKSVDLPTYKKLRLFSDNSFGMRHIYAGVVQSASHNYSSGSWRTTVSISDNMSWLKWSRYISTPTLSDVQGLLEDPLTPYVQETDDSGRLLSAQGVSLLNENKQLINSGLLVYDSGILNGQYAKESNLLQGQYSDSGSLRNTKILQHPSGLVYRWKTGIVTATAGISVVDPINEDAVSALIHRQTVGLQIAQEVLNNLDSANILSILIVGQPYNVESFIRQAYQAHNLNQNSSTNSNTAQPALSSIIDVVRRQNNHLGNFRPYRMITLSNQTMNESFNKSFIRNEANEKLKKLRSRRIELQRKYNDLTRVFEINSRQSLPPLAYTLQREIDAINASINEQIKVAIKNQVPSGDLLTENFNLFGNNRVLPLTGNFTADAEITRALMIVGAQRRIEDVRLNRDQNLFIVSDQYDDNTDIRNFLLDLKGSQYKIFEGQYVPVFEKCKAAASIPNFEFFCNTQGHIEFRPPQWNRTPLSVLRTLFQLKKEKNINVIPKFLEDLFDTKTTSLNINIHTLNVKIAILALLLNKYPDRYLIPGINSVGKSSLKFFGIKVSEDSAGSYLELKINKFQNQLSNLESSINSLTGTQLGLDISLGEEGNILSGNTNTLLGVFDPIFQEQQSVYQSILTVNAGGQNNTGSNKAGSSPRSEGYSNPEQLNELRRGFRDNFGVDPVADILSIGYNSEITEEHFIFSADGDNSKIYDKTIKIDDYLAKLSATISQRDELVSTLNQLREKRNELSEIDQLLSGEFTEPQEEYPKLIETIDKAYNTVKAVNDIISGETTKGSLFDHLIEDDTRNLLGPGSGRRFIINDSDIVDASFSEEPPDYVRVNVFGSNPLTGEAQQRAFNDRYYWAGATDFDLWRQYGFKDTVDQKLPYANNAETQCRPFALFLMQNQRAKINRGSVTVIGNEYYEPGDVVYIPTKGLLYYITSVQHRFSYGSSFSTSLTLVNGHAPGTYLPSPLDIIGQQLSKDDPTATILTYRNLNGDDQYRVLQPDSALIFPPGPLLNENQLNVLLDYRDNMSRFTNMMINLSSLIVGNRVVLIRGFSRGANVNDEERVNNNMALIKKLLLNPQMITQGEPLAQSNPGFSNLGDDALDFGASNLRWAGIEAGSTKDLIKLTLPNGLPIIVLSPQQIIEQKVSLGPDVTSEIKCLNSLLSEKLNNGNSPILPKGGPKQKTWLDFRDDFTQVSNIIEIGILDIEKEYKVS